MRVDSKMFLVQALASPVWEMCCSVGHTTLLTRTLTAATALSPDIVLTLRPKTHVPRQEGSDWVTFIVKHDILINPGGPVIAENL